MKQEVLEAFVGRDIGELTDFLRRNFYILSFQRIAKGKGSYIVYEIWGGDK